MPCQPININSPTGPSGAPLLGFGLPFALPVPNLSPDLGGFPEDLLELLDRLQLLIPPGALKPQLSLNSGKDVLDAILKLLDQFMPFLMLYKFFLPILKMILCVIEVICAIPNIFKVARAVKRLFRNCIPEFLNLFPIFALIVMIISLLLLLLALIEYIIAQILKLIEAILRNINALIKSFSDADQNSVLSIAKKLGDLLCIFQNIFVLLSIFTIIIQVIRDILNLLFKIPPCERTPSSDSDGCCTPDVCPTFIANGDYTRTTGSLQYLRPLGFQPTLPFPGLPNFSTPWRSESWTIYDAQQTQEQAFINIIDAFDVEAGSGSDFIFSPRNKKKPSFFPTETYNAETPPQQAPYTVDIRVFYNPSNWGRTNFPNLGPGAINPGNSRFIRFNNCIVIRPPSRNLKINNGTIERIDDGTLLLAGGEGYEDDGYTILTGFADDGITTISDQATLENFFHKPERFSTTGTITPLPEDGYTFSDITYTFRPNFETLVSKQLITVGCIPTVALNRDFINASFGADTNFKTQELGDIINGRNGNSFPDPQAAQNCLQTALGVLRNNMTPAGVAQFQATTTICLQQLKDDTTEALQKLIGLGVEPCNSNFSLEPSIQFTSRPIKITVDLKERNGLPLTTGLPSNVAQELATKIKAHQTFGFVDRFIYDGYQSFTSNLTSQNVGDGEMMISFDDQIFCLNNISTDIDVDPSRTLKSIAYQFVSAGTSTSSTGTGDGAPRRDEGDIARTDTSSGDSGVS